MSEEKEWLTTREAAEVVGIPLRTLQQLCQDGILPSRRRRKGDKGPGRRRIHIKDALRMKRALQIDVPCILDRTNTPPGWQFERKCKHLNVKTGECDFGYYQVHIWCDLDCQYHDRDGYCRWDKKCPGNLPACEDCADYTPDERGMLPRVAALAWVFTKGRYPDETGDDGKAES